MSVCQVESFEQLTPIILENECMPVELSNADFDYRPKVFYKFFYHLIIFSCFQIKLKKCPLLPLLQPKIGTPFSSWIAKEAGPPTDKKEKKDQYCLFYLY